jgi:hypothetical protein
MRSTRATEQLKPSETGVKTTEPPTAATQSPQDPRRLDSPTAVLQMQTSVGNRVVTRLIENRVPQIARRDLAGGGVPTVASPGPREVPPLSPSPSPVGVRGRTAGEPGPVRGASGRTTGSAAGVAAPGPGSGPARPAADAAAATGAAASNAGVAPPAASATPLPATIAALPNLTATTAPGVTSVAGVAVSTLGNQLSVKAYDKAPKGPMPTGLPIGPEPVLPQEPTIPEARDVSPGGDPESPEAIEAATQGGATQLEFGRRLVEQTAATDMGVGALAPTEQPGQIPALGLKLVLPTGGPPAIDSLADPEVADLLERVHGKQGRETAARGLGPAQSMLADGEQTIETQQTDAAELLRTQNEQATLEQVAAREAARMAVEQDKAELRNENTKAIEEYQRQVSSEKTTAQAEVLKAKEDARKAEERARNEPEEEEDDEAWYERAWSKVKSGARAVAGAVKDAVVAAYRFVKERVQRFFSKVRELVSRGISKIREIGGRIYRAIRDKVKSALNRIKDIARRIGSFVKDVVKRVGSFISDVVGRIVDFFKDVIGRIVEFWRKVWAFAVKVKELIKLIANGAIQVFVDLIENTRAVIAKVKGSIQEFINNTPAKIQEVYDTHIAPLLNGKRRPGGQEPDEGSASAAGPGGVVARAFIQRQQQDAEPEEEVKETHSEGVWRHLEVRGNYFVDNWWDVVKDALFEILVPGVAMYRHAPAMWKKVKEAWHAFSAGKPSQGWDAVLDAARELWAMVGVFIAQVSIAAFIIGSILGTPIVGVAALTAIGLGVIAIDIALQAATIAKAVSNFDDADEDEKRLEEDYGRVADSSIAIVIMLVLVALGAVAKATAATLLRRFPALGRIAEGLKAKVKGSLGIKPKRPPKMTSKLKPLDPVPPPAVHPERAKMPADLQLAFDKWMSERPPGFDPTKALAGKNEAALRRMFQTQLDWLAEQRAREVFNKQWEGEMLEPKTKNTGNPSKDVETRWNDTPPAEVDQGLRLNAKTGEKITLFGDDFPGIDGTIGKPPRPLQLKAVPATEDIANIPRVAGDALKKARAHGFSRVEVSIEAPGRTVAEVKAAFKANPTAFTDSVGVSRVRVWCSDGVFEPTSFSPSPPPIHPNLDSDKPKDAEKDKVPAGAASGG